MNKIKDFLMRDMDSILDAIYDDVLISDGNGIVLKVSPTFENVYGISNEKAVGNSVYDLEEQGYFKPSATALVLKEKQKVTIRQQNKSGRMIVVTATPVFDEDHNIKLVISFSRDITEMINLQEQYAALELEIKTYEKEIAELNKLIFGSGEFVSKSPAMQGIMRTLDRVSKFDTNILLLGPSGVGKSMLAKYTHEQSHRAKGPFVEINCAAIPENLLESELFGYAPGSFTGASKEGKKGLIQEAEGGTLFLDEISEMPLALQGKLLRAIQEKTITRVGDLREQKVDFRLIAATNRDLEAYVKEGQFRMDLFYRLNVIGITIPPLSERKEDLIELTRFLLEKLNRKYNLSKWIEPIGMERIINHPWPGNVRELENTLERAVITSEAQGLNMAELASCPVDGNMPSVSMDTTNLQEAIETLESSLVRSVYAREKNSAKVAKALGVSQPTAYRKIQKYVYHSDEDKK